MRRCFVCSSDRICSHRESELLPPATKRMIARDVAKESTAISTSEVDAILNIPHEIERKPPGHVENDRIKAVETI